MVEVEEKGKAHASGSEPENKDSVENTDAETAASDPANLNVEGQIHASGPETEKAASVDNADSEMATPEQAKLNGVVPTTTTEGEKEENKNGENKEKSKEALQTVATPGGSSKKRKRKKVTKPKGTASAKKANAGTTAPGQVNMDVDVPTAVVDAEEKKDKKKEEGNEEQNSTEKADNALSTTPGKSRKRKRKKAPKGSAKSVPAKDTDKPETSTKQKDDKKLESMGMIFMCSSKTKQDCYRYKVFGLPATKKEEVSKIYKGMRLFLFDIDLKLMYGIYKAAEPGGYNLEPKAFNSAFPSQVRFTIVEDCLPLAEEKFKAVIKDNYYGKNKFDCKLKAEQVKNMCKLFKATTKGRESKHVGGVRKTERRVVVDRSREKLQGRDRERRQVRDRDRQQGRDKDRQQGRDRERRQGRDRERREGRGRGERVAYVGDPVHLRAAADVYGRELPLAYAPQRVAPQLPQPPSVPLTYPFERPLDVDYYRRDVQLERPDRRFLDLGLNRREEVVYRDPHETYTRAPLAHEAPLSYHESLYTRLDRDPPLSYHDSSAYARAPLTHEPTLSYREPLYSRLAPEPPLPYHDPTYARAPARDPYRY